MTGTLTHIWRHPIKSHGWEALEHVLLSAGQTMPGDRVWAVAHDQSAADGSEWVSCRNFSIGSKAPLLTAIGATLDEQGATIRLTHPDRPDLEFAPDDPAELATFLDWVAPLMPENRAQSTRIIRVPGRGMTDSDFPSITLCNMASHRAVEQAVGKPLDIRRWRGNFWFDGFALWEEFDWLDREVQLGDAIVIPRERTERCLATTANPETGNRDADTLGALNGHWGHQDFSVRAEIIKGGMVRVGDAVGLV